MRIILNGKSRKTGIRTLHELLVKFKYDPERSLVSVNGNVVEKKLFSKTAISEGDRIDVFSFVGGG